MPKIYVLNISHHQKIHCSSLEVAIATAELRGFHEVERIGECVFLERSSKDAREFATACIVPFTLWEFAQ